MTTCVVCGADVPGGKRVQPHCLTDECNIGFAHWFIQQKIRSENGCDIWTGEQRRGVAWISVVVSRGSASPERQRQEYRVLDLRTGGFARRRRYRRLCSTPACVKPEHVEVVRTKPLPVPLTGPVPGLKGHLDPQPLVDRAKRYTLPHSEQRHLEKSKKRGWITVKKADEICCDYLDCNPVELYGLEFLET